MLSRFDAIPERDGHTDRHTVYVNINIVRQHTDARH